MTSRETLSLALQAYEHVRLPAANDVLKGSRESGLMYEFNHPNFGENYEILGPAIQKQWEWVWASHPDECVEKGLTFLRERITSLRPEIPSCNTGFAA